MRLFVGIELSSEVLDAAAALVGRLRERSHRLAPTARIGWVTAERFHITVRFIGHVTDVKADEIAEVFRPALPLQPFVVKVDGLGAFPPSGAPRVIWAGVGDGTGALKALQSMVSERLSTRGIAGEDRPYNPHLTLARVREAGGLRSRMLLEYDRDTALGVTAVEAITLFESRLSPKGPAYVPLLRTRLAGDA